MVEQQRMDVTKLAPEAYKHLLQLEQTIARSGRRSNGSKS
jgi:hypothetical protein